MNTLKLKIYIIEIIFINSLNTFIIEILFSFIPVPITIQINKYIYFNNTVTLNDIFKTRFLLVSLVKVTSMLIYIYIYIYIYI